MYEVGDVIELRLDIYVPGSDPPTPPAAVDEPSSVVLTITLPDGTSQTPVVTHVPGSGAYLVSYLSTLQGLHRVRWVATGFNSGVHEDSFNVEEAQPTLLVSEAEAIAHLRAHGVITSARDRDQLRWLCRLATDEVEADLNRYVVRREVTQTFPAGSCSFWLRGPVVSLVDVTIGGVTADVSQFTAVDGKLSYGFGYLTIPYWSDTVVRYIAGDGTPPTIARQVALRGIQRAWQQSQQMSHPSLDDLGAEASLFTPAGQLTPLELNAYNRLRVPVMA